MKAIVCEMCGGHDLVKKDGLFVCQSCGTKYSTEEAKKLLVDGVVSVSGTVKVDNTASVENYLKMAKNALDSKNYKEAEDYSNRVIEIDTTNYVAWLQKGIAAGWQSTLQKIRIDETANCFSQALEHSPDDKKESTKKLIVNHINGLADAIIRMACNHFYEFPSGDTAILLLDTYRRLLEVFLALLSKCGVDADNINDSMCDTLHNAAVVTWNERIRPEYNRGGHPDRNAWNHFMECGDGVIKIIECSFNENNKYSSDGVNRYKDMVAIEGALISANVYRYTVINGQGVYAKEYCLSDESRWKRMGKINEWNSQIQRLEPSYVAPPPPAVTKPACYIATSVYGSYDCPQVWTLRRFRDDSLAQTHAGRLFIRSYYAISPTLVKYFGDTAWFKWIWKRTLDRMVCRLKRKGYGDEPYTDKQWIV